VIQCKPAASSSLVLCYVVIVCKHFSRGRAEVLTQRVGVQFVMRHAPGARALKFVRRLPLFKGLGDNNLVSVASRMREKVYQVGQLAML